VAYASARLRVYRRPVAAGELHRGGAFDVTEEEVVDVADPVAEFFETHEVATDLTRIYCRVDVATPDCRTLIRYRAVDGGDLVESFRMTFSSPVAQSGGTELFLKVGDDAFERFTDASVDGEEKFESAGELQASVLDVPSDDEDRLMTTTVTIYDINFGALVADLTFDEREALFEGEIQSDDGPSPFSRSYPRLVPEALAEAPPASGPPQG